MRVLAAIGVWVLVMGGLWLFMGADRGSSGPGAALPVATAAEGVYALEVLSTAALGPDPFALAGESGALSVSLNGKQLLVTDSLAAGRPLVLEPVTGLVEGTNEFYAQAAPPDPSGAFALRLTLYRGRGPGRRVVAESTLWSEAGRAAGVMRLELGEEEAARAD